MSNEIDICIDSFREMVWQKRVQTAAQFNIESVIMAAKMGQLIDTFNQI